MDLIEPKRAGVELFRVCARRKNNSVDFISKIKKKKRLDFETILARVEMKVNSSTKQVHLKISTRVFLR